MRISESRSVSIWSRDTASSASTRRVEPAAPAAANDGDRGGASPVPETLFEEAVEAPMRIVRHRPFAPFIAQLIANREGFAETRRRRRAEPGAVAAYARVERGEGLLVPGYFVDTAR